MGIYECSLPWCSFRSCFRDFWYEKMCGFTKLTASSIDITDFSYSSLNSIHTIYNFINCGTDCICVWKHLKENIFGMICTSS